MRPSKFRRNLGVVLLIATFVTVVSGCSGSKTYSQKQVKSAFKSHGIRLTPLVVNGTKANFVLIPAENSGVTYFVVQVLPSEQAARGYFRGFRSQPEPLALRNKNVIVSTKARLDPDLRRQITLSVESLH